MPTSSRSVWGFSLRDDVDSDSGGDPVPVPVPQPPAPRPPPLQSELDRLIAAEVDGLEDDGELVPEEAKDEIDIGAINEGHVPFVETPFTIAARLAASRKRKANHAGSDSTPLPANPSRSGANTAATDTPEPVASSSRKNLGPLQQGFKRQTEIASSKPPATKPRKLAPPKETIPAPSAAPVADLSLEPTATSHGDKAFQTALSASGSTSSAVRASGSTPRRGSLLTAHSSPPPAPSPRHLSPGRQSVGPTTEKVDRTSGAPALDLDFSRSPSSSPRAPAPPQDRIYGLSYTTSLPPPPGRASPSPLQNQFLSIVSPRPSLPHSAHFSSDPALPPTSFDNTHKAYRSSPTSFTSRLPPVTLGPGSVSSSRVATGPRVVPTHSPLPPTPPQPFHQTRPAPLPPSALSTVLQRRPPPIPLSPFSAPKKSRRNPPHLTSSSPLRPPASPPRWSTLAKNVIPTPSHFGSAVSGPSATTSTADRFALPGLAMPGRKGRGKMAFKPSELLGSFKARREEGGSSADAQELRLRLGAGLRSVKGPGEGARKKPRREETDDERLQRVYRGMD